MKNCKNCANLQGATCLASGTHYKIERQYNKVCDKNFSAWVEKPTLSAKWRKFFDSMGIGPI